jgi:hypothetical protein
MDFLKKHYEKVLLGVVLLGLAVAVAFLPFKIANEKEALETMRQQYRQRPVKELTNLDLTLPDAALKRAAVPAHYDFSAPHRLFNPMPWQKKADGQLIKVDASNIGPNALVVTKMVPLYLKLTLDSVMTSESGSRYVIGIENEAGATVRDRRKTQKYCSVGTKTDIFTLRKAQPAPDNPSNVVVVLELNDTRKLVDVSKNQPFRRAEGYMVDLKYAPETKNWNNRRVGDKLVFNGEEYNIVAITEDEVVLSAKSNQKKWPVKYNASAAH